MNTFADRMQYVIALDGVDEDEIRKRAGIRYTTWRDAISGVSKQPRAAADIAAALNVDLTWLLKGVGSMRPDGQRTPAAQKRGADVLTTVMQFNVTASMGDGSVVDDHPAVIQGITVSLEELRKQASFSSPPNLSFISGRGDSMTPTFSDGDMLLVDQNVAEHKIDAVFAFTYDGEFYVKTLQRVPGRGVMAVSHNRTVYEPFKIEPGRPFTIHGRVVLAWNARKL